jgi:hypothetical protein
VDWDAVRADVREMRDESAARAQQIVAEARAAGRPLRLKDQERRAALQAYVDAADAFLEDTS